MSNITDWQSTFNEASVSVFQTIFSFLPTLLAAVLVFVIGLVLARFLKKLTVRLFSELRLSRLAQMSGLETFLNKAEIKIKIEEILGNLVKWIIIFIFFITAVNILGLQSVSMVLNGILGAIPRVLSAAFILTAGILLAGLIESLVKGSVAQIDLKLGRVAGKFASYIVVIFVVLAAINEIGIAQALINSLFIGVVAMLALGFGLALGLGAKDLVAKILNEWYEQLKEEIRKK